MGARAFIGEYKGALDEKNRLRLPPAFKEGLGESPYVMVADNNCLYVITEETYLDVEARLMEADLSDPDVEKACRNWWRKLYPVKYDNQGRILIPPPLIEHARLHKELEFHGAGRKVEIWAKEEWSRYDSSTPANMSNFYKIVKL